MTEEKEAIESLKDYNTFSAEEAKVILNLIQRQSR